MLCKLMTVHVKKLTIYIYFFILFYINVNIFRYISVACAGWCVVYYEEIKAMS